MMISANSAALLILGCALSAPIMARASAFTDLHDFAGGTDGSYPSAALTPMAGALFGTTTGGNSSDNPASIFRVDPATGQVANTVLPYGFSFLGSLLPVGTLLYGTAEYAPVAGNGMVFSFDPAAGKLTPIHTFTSSTDGATPLGSLAQNDGVLYGATVGGSNFNGTLFSVDLASGKEAILHRFHGTDGNQPSAGVSYAFGALFGTTYQGGAQNQGEVFRYDLATHELKVLHSFARGTDGASPLCNLVVTPEAVFGTTEFAGKYNLGTIFRIDLATGAATILHSFAPATSAAEYGPNAGLALFEGALFGITTYNGQSDYGTVFKIER